MIKIITIDSSCWNIGVYKNSDEHIPENKRKYAYESSILNEFLNDGWTIKDWKMCIASGPYRNWTFILEKEDELTEPIEA
jgi:hypothetical protein